MTKPLLLLDVDGPLNPWAAPAGAKPPGFVEHRFRLRGWSRRRPLRMWLNPALGSALSDLAGQAGLALVWATNWEHQANTMIGPAIGLPALPVIEFPSGLQPVPGRSFTWKYGAVARYAAGRPLAWLDDDFDVYPNARDAFVQRRRGANLSTELISVNPRTGITEDQLAAVLAWVRSL